jgi:transcriptional regulator with XRE-family HTH domain
MAVARSRQTVCANVSRILRQERERRGLSMTLLAEKSGLSQQMVSYVERGMRMPTLDTLLRMCDALEIELDAVIRKARNSA